jgi:16S rRNA processing protein RimM
MVMGKITGVHGLDGKLKVWSFARSVDPYAPGNQLFVRTENKDDARAYVIEKCIDRKKGILLHLAGVDKRDLADALVGKEVLIRRQQLPEPDEDSWYWQDLYGLTVIDKHRGNLGIIDTIFPTGANDVLVVKNNGREILIPMHRHFVASVDLENKTVRTCLPQGYE